MLSNSSGIGCTEVNDQVLENGFSATDPDSALFLEYRKEGNEDAFAKLVDAYHGSACGIALRFLGDRHLSEDIVQDCWMKVFKNQTFDSSQKFSTWFYSVVRHACIDYLRHRKTQEVPDAFSSISEKSIDEHAVAQDPLIQRIVSEQLYFFLDLLEPKYQKVLVRRHIDGWSTKEVAAEEGLKRGAVQLRYNQAMEQMRKKYDMLLNDVN